MYTNVKILNCSRNNLIVLTNLPPNLEILKCCGNKLIALDNLQASLKNL